MQFRQRFGCFDAQAVQIEIFCILATFKQPLRLDACFRANRNQRQPDHIHLSGSLGSEEVRYSQSPTLPLAREGKPQQLTCGDSRPRLSGRAYARLAGSSARATRAGFIHDYIISIGLGREVAIHNLGFKQSRTRNLILQFAQNRTEFLIHQPDIVRLRSGFELPLILEQSRLVDVLKHLAQIVILAYAHTPEWGNGNIWSIAYHRAAFRKHWPRFFVDRRGQSRGRQASGARDPGSRISSRGSTSPAARSSRLRRLDVLAPTG